MNEAALIQQRKAVQQIIDENSVTLRIGRKPLVDNGVGQMVDNPYGIDTITEVKGRIAKQQRFPEGYGVNAAGFSIVGSWYLLVNHNAVIYKDDKFYARDRGWKIGPVAEIVRFGGVIAYEAPLIEAEETVET